MDTVLAHPLASKLLAFAVLRVPFFLEPNYDETKPHVESNRQRLLQKWGGRQGWAQQKQHHNLKGRGLEAGIPHFNLDRLAANSMASHRLIQYLGKTYGLAVSEKAYDVLNHYYFVQGHSLNDRPRVAQVVAEALSSEHPNNNTTTTAAPAAEQLLDFMNGTEGRAEVQAAVAALERLGVHGIPKFLLEGGHTVVDGAATADVFVDIFRRIEARGTVVGGGRPVFADILGVSPAIVARGSHPRHHYPASDPVA